MQKKNMSGKQSFQNLILVEDPICRVVGCAVESIQGHHIIYKSKWTKEIESRLEVKMDSLSNGIGLCAEHHFQAHNGTGLKGISGREFMYQKLDQLVKISGFHEARWGKVWKELEKSLILKGKV